MHWTPASVPAFAPVDVDIGKLVQSGRRDALAFSPYAEWYENSLRFPDSPVARHHREVYGDRPYVEFADDWEAGPRAVGPARVGGAFRGDRRALRRVRDEAHGRLLPVADRRSAIRVAPGWNCRRDVVGELSEAVRGAGMRFGDLLLGRARLDVQRPADRIGVGDARRDPARRLSRVRRGPGPRAHRPLPAERVVERHRLAGRRQAAVAAVRALLRAGSRRRRQRPVDAVEPAARRGTARSSGAGRSTLGFDARRSATRASCRRSRRTPTCARPNTSSSTTCSASRGSACGAWTRASATTRAHVRSTSSGTTSCCGCSPTSSPRAATCSSTSARAGSTRRFPTSSSPGSTGSADGSGPHADAIAATRPWVTPGTTTAPTASPVRYTARDDTVYAFVRDATGFDHAPRRGRDPDDLGHDRRRDRVVLELVADGPPDRPAARRPVRNRASSRCATSSPAARRTLDPGLRDDPTGLHGVHERFVVALVLVGVRGPRSRRSRGRTNRPCPGTTRSRSGRPNAHGRGQASLRRCGRTTWLPARASRSTSALPFQSWSWRT